MSLQANNLRFRWRLPDYDPDSFFLPLGHRRMSRFLDLAETGRVPRDVAFSPDDAHAGQQKSLVAMEITNGLHVIDQALLQRSVGEEERMCAAVAVRMDWRGHVGIDGDDAVAGCEGLHRELGLWISEGRSSVGIRD